ncbi:uncharacterized protein LOC133923185 [Phragmites australis]|uniref:uncharacterized protein LOC133923185 n=1 Tax=Phragmites australis TaxID=29695 RepID=UPI002D787F2F|nr:uncharacterized protein LOC133923185 [Phragmites australis]
MGKDIRSFPLPEIDEAHDTANGVPRKIFEESTIEVDHEDATLSDSLDAKQRAAYDEILSAVDSDKGDMFFVDGPGWTGETFLYQVLLATIRKQEKIVVATATSDVLASRMPGGRTTHSRFKIQLSVDDVVFCSFTKLSGVAKLLWIASLIIWNEASMTQKQVMEALDNNICDIMSRPELPLCGKTIVFGGDFR